MIKTALIDGDILLYMCGFAAQKNVYEVYSSDGLLVGEYVGKTELNQSFVDFEGLTIEHRIDVEPVAQVLGGVKNTINAIVERAGCQTYEIYLSCPNNFRNNIAKYAPYKAGRPDKPVMYDTIKSYLIKNQGAIVATNMEADDALGIEAYKRPAGSFVICSIDKDLLMLAGDHYHLHSHKITTVPEETTKLTFYRQVLTGDATDNIIGIYKLGPVTASKLITPEMSEEACFLTCVEEYYKWHMKIAGLDYKKNVDANVYEKAVSHVIENCNLLWILRSPDGFYQPPVSQIQLLKRLPTMNGEIKIDSSEQETPDCESGLDGSEIQDTGLQEV